MTVFRYYLEVLETVQSAGGDGRIGKDDIRILSRSNFQRRIGRSSRTRRDATKTL